MALNPRKAQPVIWDGDWSKVPATLDARWMAAIEGVSVETIWDRIQQGRMVPAPVRPWRPYRWDRSVVQAERIGA
jgi:predicted DNA-binding transcriptional regulator AlpA